MRSIAAQLPGPKWRPYTAFKQLRILAEDLRIGVPVGHLMVSVGDVVQFTTRHADACGTVLSIDHGAGYPIRIEYHDKHGHKRIVSFKPDEFITFTLKG